MYSLVTFSVLNLYDFPNIWQFYQNKGLQIVSQLAYPHAQSAVSSPSNVRTKLEWEALNNQNQNPDPNAYPVQKPEQDGPDRISPVLIR